MKSKIINIQKKDPHLIEFDRTNFRPQGGGQPADSGVITKENKEYLVIDVQKINNKIIHFIEHAEELTIGDSIETKPDLKNRKSLSKMHTTEHILVGCIKKDNKNAEVEKVIIDSLESTVFIRGDFDIKAILKSEKTANEIISKSKPIKEHIISKAEFQENQFPGIRIKKERIKEDHIRIIEVDNLDFSACCGSHVKNTSEIGSFLITKTNKTKNTWEIKFKLNAKEEMYKFADITRIVKNLLNIDYADIESNITNLKKNNKKLKNKLRELSKQIEIKPTEENIHNTTLITAILPGINKKDFIEKLSNIDKKNSIITFINTDLERQTIAIKSNSKTSASDLLKLLLEKLTGAGGGNDKLAQGSIETNNPEEIINNIREILTNLKN